MKKHMKQIFCLLLVLAMLICVVACGENETSDTSTEGSGAESETSTEPKNEYIGEDGKYMTKLGVLDEYKDMVFDILVVGESAGTYQSDDFTTEQGSGGIDYGDAFYTEVQARNDKVEEDTGVTIEVHKVNDTNNEARNDATTGTRLYDAMILNVDGAAKMAQDGLLINLHDLQNLDIKAPWWDQNANSAYTISDKLYFTTGDITIMNKANTWSILFNKDMIEDAKLESPYDLFESDDWTFDKMCEMAQTVNTANGAASYEDDSVIYGMLSAYGDIYRIYGAFGSALCEKNAQDEPMLVFGKDESSINNTIKILEKLNGAAWNIYAEQIPTDPWNVSFSFFYNGRVLFRPSGFTATTKLRALATMEFGIAPMPKLNKEQEEYWTITNGSFAACISKSCEDPEFSAYMLDQCACQAKNFITPAYVEANLKWKALRDDDSADILDYIFDHIIYDTAGVYNFGSITNLFYNLAKAQSTDVASSLDAIKDQVESDIQTVIADYEADF